MTKTPLPTKESTSQKWYVVDAAEQRLGRLATEIAMILRGKNKPTFTPHMDTGDFVIVVNASKCVPRGLIGGMTTSTTLLVRQSVLRSGTKTVFARVTTLD